MRVYIKWLDHCTTIGWLDAATDDFSPTTMESMGYIVKENEQYIVVSTTKDSNGCYADPLTILKSCIIKRKNLKS